MKHHLSYNTDGDEGEELLFKGVKVRRFRPATSGEQSTGTRRSRRPGWGRTSTFMTFANLGNQLAANAGASTRELMRRLGQPTINAAMIYQHATRKRDREIAAGIDEALTHGAADDEDSDDDDGLAGVPAGGSLESWGHVWGTATKNEPEEIEEPGWDMRPDQAFRNWSG